MENSSKNDIGQAKENDFANKHSKINELAEKLGGQAAKMVSEILENRLIPVDRLDDLMNILSVTIPMSLDFDRENEVEMKALLGQALSFEKVIEGQEPLLTKWQARECVNGRASYLRMGKLVLLDHIGKGGMTDAVILAIDTTLPDSNERVVKISSAAALQEDQALMERECQMANRAQHGEKTHFATYYGKEHHPEYGECDVFEHLQKTLSQKLIEAKRTLSDRQGLQLVFDLAKGLAHLEDVGIVHCDIKGDNTMMRHGDENVILDFGMAQEIGDEPLGGTPSHMCLEHFEKKPAEPHFDVYAAMITLCLALTGKHPFGEMKKMKPIDFYVSQARDKKVPSLPAKDFPICSAICEAAITKRMTPKELVAFIKENYSLQLRDDIPEKAEGTKPVEATAFEYPRQEISKSYAKLVGRRSFIRTAAAVLFGAAATGGIVVASSIGKNGEDNGDDPDADNKAPDWLPKKPITIRLPSGRVEEISFQKNCAVKMTPDGYLIAHSFLIRERTNEEGMAVPELHIVQITLSFDGENIVMVDGQEAYQRYDGNEGEFVPFPPEDSNSRARKFLQKVDQDSQSAKMHVHLSSEILAMMNDGQKKDYQKGRAQRTIDVAYRQILQEIVSAQPTEKQKLAELFEKLSLEIHGFGRMLTLDKDCIATLTPSGHVVIHKYNLPQGNSTTSYMLGIISSKNGESFMIRRRVQYKQGEVIDTIHWKVNDGEEMMGNPDKIEDVGEKKAAQLYSHPDLHNFLVNEVDVGNKSTPTGDDYLPIFQNFSDELNNVPGDHRGENYDSEEAARETLLKELQINVDRAKNDRNNE